MAKPTPDDYRAITEQEIATVLAEDLDFKGTLRFKTSLMIKGGFEGEVVSEGLLYLGPNARIKANIRTATLISHGKVEGNVEATKGVFLCKGSSHAGDLKTPNLLIESGAVFNGQCAMPEAAEAHPVGAPKKS